MLDRRRFLQLSSAGALAQALPAQRARRPNIVFLYADDLGYRDIGCFGDPDVRTPNLDRLAADGIRLTDFHVAAPVCGPSRSGLLTGRYPLRNGLFTNIRNDITDYGHKYNRMDYATSPEMTQGLDLREVTIAQRLKDAGYRTGIVGKWDSGRDYPFLPLQRGFDFFYGFANTGIDYFTHERYGVPSLFRGNEQIEEEGYATDLFRREAIGFIEKSKDRPFFLYLPFNAPHAPSNLEKTGPQAPEKYVRMYGQPPGSAHVRYMANVTCMDDAIGAVLGKLKELNLENDTLVMFASDNGGTKVGSNGPLRGWKGDVYEGGHRVPFIARWPGRIPKGKVSNEFAGTLDVFATWLKLGGGVSPASIKLDGYDILPVLTSGAASPRKEQYWEMFGSRAGRFGNWKWVTQGKRGNPPSPSAPGELFNLADDLGEKHDLGKENPKMLREMKERCDNWMREMAQAETRGPFSRDYYRLLGFPKTN
jgi:arylsulfatase A-like enzyme